MAVTDYETNGEAPRRTEADKSAEQKARADPGVMKTLAEKLNRLTESRDAMEAVNAYYRGHGTLDGCPFLTREEAEKLKADMLSGFHCENVPYTSNQLADNDSEIRRVEKRIAEAGQNHRTAYAGWEFDGGYVEPDREDNRLRVFFDERPDEETRVALKKHGFRWSPLAEAWQGQLNDNTYYAAKRIPGLRPLMLEGPADLQKKAED